MLTVLSAGVACVVADLLGVSGVLTAVLSGIYGGWHAHATFDADTRLSATPSGVERGRLLGLRGEGRLSPGVMRPSSATWTSSRRGGADRGPTGLASGA